MTISECLNRLDMFPYKVANEGMNILRSHASPHTKTGALERSIGVKEMSDSYIFIGTDIHYAKYVVHGRGEVTPNRPAYALYWEGLPHPVPRARAYQGDNFVAPAANELRSKIVSLF